MSGIRVDARRARTRNKALALAAAGVVLSAGIAVPSLAAWTDEEWVTGGVGNVPGITASSFEVQQFAEGDTVWGDYETQPEANVIDFSAQAASLTPGDTVYGYVRLRVVAGSLGGTLSLGADTVVTTSTLSEALTYSARVMDAVSTCNATDYAATGSELQPSGALDAATAGTFSLAAAPDAVTPGTEQVVCFAITFPSSFSGDTALQGQTATPVWHFDAVSV
ncbi:SipW-dependent-type signal peptide-containing protein [Protaetiibacter mangrovi]|uniref:SipW-dependent-type signal peptide-containing protein n=1 Tax=Protaetiibacter mangrovi TaxID=2970926 RepID=A0ABT1ZJ47_9MICO|nr:SipW-dependent-type signal peptide-containing protein [Protaetiibacter mangrovi]MCS0500739.1 SipW-dependent-type signal peptide-containing protein [Protaetiibacter mangrovi]